MYILILLEPLLFTTEKDLRCGARLMGIGILKLDSFLKYNGTTYKCWNPKANKMFQTFTISQVSQVVDQDKVV